jgi:hypothetical protein
MQLQSSGLGVILSFFLIAAVCAPAQVPAQKQTDVALSVYGAFSNTVGKNNANLTQDSPSNSAGGMIELRHIHSLFIGYEAAYSFNRANQVYTVTVNCIVNSKCPTSVIVSANAHEFTGDWVFSTHPAKLRPYALVGAGILLTVPVSGLSEDQYPQPVQSSDTPVYVYGVGLDWEVLPHLGLRFQYRGNVHKAPYMTTDFGGSSDPFQHTAEPAIGVYYKF